MSLVSSLIWRTRSARRKRIKRAIAKPKSSGGERTNASSLNRKFSKPPTMRSASYLPNSKPRSARKQSASFCANIRGPERGGFPPAPRNQAPEIVAGALGRKAIPKRRLKRLNRTWKINLCPDRKRAIGGASVSLLSYHTDDATAYDALPCLLGARHTLVVVGG